MKLVPIQRNWTFHFCVPLWSSSYFQPLKKTQRCLKHLAIHLINSSLQLRWNNREKKASKRNTSPNLYIILETSCQKLETGKGKNPFIFSLTLKKKEIHRGKTQRKATASNFSPQRLHLRQWSVSQFTRLLLGVSGTLLICVLFSFCSTQCRGNKVCFN